MSQFKLQEARKYINENMFEKSMTQDECPNNSMSKMQVDVSDKV